MARLSSPRINKRPRLEIIPFIDIMFFLLATYMMVSLSMIQNQGIILHLPAAGTATPDTKPNEITLSIDAKGTMSWNKEVVSEQVLKANLMDLKQQNTEAKLVIQADKACDYGTVVRVLDMARNVGLTKFILRTQRE
jgi:biopolymer transport protein ExbD